jgi:PTS system N-acetylglucosamine-specific IIB component
VIDREGRISGRDYLTRRHKVDKAQEIRSLLGGSGNIVELVPCITRLRVEVADPAKVDEPGLRAAGAYGVVVSGRIIQVVVGPGAEVLAEAINAAE